MNTHADKTTETKSNAAANGMAVQQDAAHETSKLEDNRTETITQKKIQEAANNSPQVMQLKAIQAMANNSVQVKQLRAVQAMIHSNKEANIPGKTITDNTHEPVQRQVALDDASDFNAWDGDDLYEDSEEFEDVIEELKDDFDWGQYQVGEFEKLVKAPALFTFRDFDHLNDFVGGNHHDPPKVDNGEGTAEMVDDIAKDFGAEFKGPNIPFSGSRVYAVGRHGGVNPELWATQNSATGHITSKQQAVVKQWVPETPAKVLLDKLNFPTNTKRSMNQVGMGRPDVMPSNAHAEVNQYVQLALLAASHGLNPSDIGLAIGSDIAHCAECYWALEALKQKGTGNFATFTGCENKLFARWREPWTGFYATYGPNPFRNSDGTFKKNVLTNKKFDAGTYTAQELNAVSPYKIYK